MKAVNVKNKIVTYLSSRKIGLIGNQEDYCATSLLSQCLSFLGKVSALAKRKEIGLE